MFAKPFDLLLGRRTYDIFAAHWPYAPPDDPIGRLFDRIDKYVATRNETFQPEWKNSHVLGPDVVVAVRELKDEDGPDLLTQGSTDFLKSLLANDLVDELNISFFPLVLGKGKRLFADTSFPALLKLAGCRGFRRHQCPIRPWRRYRYGNVRIRAANRSRTDAAQKSPDGVASRICGPGF